MPRSNNLDDVAPDDPITSKPESSASAESKEVKPESSETKKDSENLSPPPRKSKSDYRQKINTILGKTKSPFSSFLINPKVFNFEEKDDEETIILALRQHWITNVPWIIMTILMLLFPLLFNYVSFLHVFPSNYQLVVTIFWYLVTFAFAFEKFLGWYFNVYIITDERVIDIDFNNLLDKKFSEAGLNMIQDVTSHVVGVSQTLFNYGNVLIQTAAEIPEIVFERVPNPEKIIKVLQQLRQEEEQEALDGRVK